MTNRLEQFRIQAGLSVAALAGQAGVTRQTIYAIEAGSFAPNTTVALKLARILQSTVEDLFLPDDPGPPEYLEPVRAGQPIRMAQVNGRLMAVPAQVLQFPASDPNVLNRIVIAGCDPAISLLGPNVIPANCGSTRAMRLLAEGKAHIAGTHIGRYPKKGHRVVTFAKWEEGILVPPGNPRKIRSVADLVRVRIVNREEGSGSRILLDREREKAGIPRAKLRGYKTIAAGHLEAAWYVRTGQADACIATSSAARVFGLDFVTLAEERYDLVIPDAFNAEAFLNLLTSGATRRLLQSQAGYDTSRTGERV